MSAESYTLTIINDDAVALAGAIPTNTNNHVVALTVVMVLLVSAVIAVSTYMYMLHKYQSRLLELTVDGSSKPVGYNSKNISFLKNQIAIMEHELAESHFTDFFS